MDDMRDRLMELVEPHMSGLPCEFESGSCELTNCRSCNARALADHLLANGVQMSKSSCPYCCANGEGHGRLASSYDDEDGMKMSIHPSAKRANGYQSQAWWATVHFRGECRDFYIEVCPFCGRRLVPLKEEYEACCP